jgi:diaminohydroxyphosphoribosylaminopyrimidine deaminase/5-amino-6-(5-phosphoribosylamino)uracil reductase
LPWVTLKAAVSLDGQMATQSGDSRWITGVRARTDAHRLRARHHAIAVGVGTVLADDPALTVRHVRGTDPIRVVFDSRLRLASQIGKRKLVASGTVVLHTAAAAAARRRRLSKAGVEPVLVRADKAGRVQIKAALQALGKRDIRSLMVEGGPRMLASFHAASRWEEFCLYQAPKLLGEGRAMLEGWSADRVASAPAVEVLRRRTMGEDVLIVLRRG